MLSNYIQNKNPRSYQPGVLLNHIKNDLRNAQCTNDQNFELFVNPINGPEFKVVETVKKDFLQHISIAKFILPLSIKLKDDDIHVSLSHTGWLKRKAIDAKVIAGTESATILQEHILNSKNLISNLMELDFTSFDIKSDRKVLSAQVSLYGGSEVVSRFPSFRRYIRLDKQQQNALINCFEVLSQMKLQ